jgi:5-methylcytosine-specific restriction endonuclease McrA
MKSKDDSVKLKDAMKVAKKVTRNKRTMNIKERKKLKSINRKAERERYTEWSKQVKERDNYTCQISGKKFHNSDPRALQTAHILSKSNYPELKLDIMNGICLSFWHHKNAPISSHLDGFAFAIWLEKNKPEQYNYLKEFLLEKWKQS